MPAYRYSCDRCHQPKALAELVETSRTHFKCLSCRQQAERDAARDAQVNALRGAPIDQRTRTRLNAWRARMTQQKHGGATW